jgi:hypothetical protein
MTPPAAPAGQRLHLGRGLTVAAVDDLRRAKTARCLQAAVVEINHDYLGGRIELRGQESRKPNGPRAHDRHGRTGSDLSIEDAAFKTGRQDVAQHHQSLLVGTRRDRVEARIGVGDADILGLGAVDLIAENPAASGAVGVHAAPAILAFAAGRNAGN